MKTIMKYVCTIALMYLAINLQAYLSDMYWSVIFGLWRGALFPIVIQTSLFIIIRIALIIALARYLIQRKLLTSSTPYLLDPETQTISQCLPTTSFAAISFMFAFSIFIDFITIIGLVFSPKIFG